MRWCTSLSVEFPCFFIQFIRIFWWLVVSHMINTYCAAKQLNKTGCLPVTYETLMLRLQSNNKRYEIKVWITTEYTKPQNVLFGFLYTSLVYTFPYWKYLLMIVVSSVPIQLTNNFCLPLNILVKKMLQINHSALLVYIPNIKFNW